MLVISFTLFTIITESIDSLLMKLVQRVSFGQLAPSALPSAQRTPYRDSPP